MSAVNLRASLQALGGRMGGEWERERRDTLFLMGAIGLATLPQLPHLPVWIPIALALMFAWRLALLFSGHPLPSIWIRGLGAFTALLAGLAEYGSLLGREQGVAMLTLFLGLKLLEMKARRDLFVVIFLCFFLLLTAFFKSQSLLTALMVAIAVIGLVATMITMQFGRIEVSISQRFKHAAVMFVQALPIAIALFMLFPRLATPLWGIQGGGSSAQTGLSNSMAPGGVSELSRSSKVAFRVQFDTQPPGSRQRYWRGPVFADFDGRAWTNNKNNGVHSVPPTVQVQANDPSMTYEITLEASGNRWLLALDVPTELLKLNGTKATVSPEFTLLAERFIGERRRYSIKSHLQYRLGLNESSHSLARYLYLPPGFNPQTKALANEWRKDLVFGTTEAMVNRALTWFRRDLFHYTLRPPTLGKNSVDEFLFGSKAGFCEHFSSAFVVLMRALGIPARIVTGYQGGEMNPVDNYMIVRQSDAHAWAEVWSKASGWVRVDPTAAIAPERIETQARLSDSDAENLQSDSGTGLISTLMFNFDALANRWNQWVLNYDRKSQGRLLEKLGFETDDWHGLAGLLAGALVVLIGGSALLTMQPRAAKDPVSALYDAFCNKLANQGIVRHQAETPWQFLERASRMLDDQTARQARTIVAMYTRIRYGPLSEVDSLNPGNKSALANLSTHRGSRSRFNLRGGTAAAEHLRSLRRAVKRFQP